MPTVGIPEGAETYRVGPNNYVVYNIAEVVPDLDGPLYMAWQVFGNEEWERITQQKSLTKGVDHNISPDAWKRMGVIEAGISNDLSDELPEHPWKRFVNNLDQEAELRPWLRDEEFINLGAEAFMEGREVSEAEMKSTDWYQSSTSKQREWMELVNTDEASAEQQMREAQREIRNELQQLGWKGDPNSMAFYYAKQYVQGDLTDTELQDRLIHETDPFARGASPFAGFYPDEQDEVVEYNGQRYLRDSKGNYWIIGGPGQTARLGDPNQVYDEELDMEPAGTLEEYFQQRGEGPEHIALGNTEFVREQFRRWLGPHANNVSEDTIGQWAHKIRVNENAKDQLTEHLRGQRLALFPEHENPDLTWQDISEPWKNIYRQFAGHLPDDSDALFMDIVKTNDFSMNQERLRHEGLKRGWAPVIEDFMNDATQALGGTHRPAAQQQVRRGSAAGR